MIKKISYRTRIMLFFTAIIAAFTVGIILFEQQQWKNERTNSLESTLDANADIIHAYIHGNNIPLDENVIKVEEQLEYMDPDLRPTTIDWQGKALYDDLLDRSEVEDHLQRQDSQK